MKNILYIGNPNSIHDVKWISYFSNKTDNYKTYFIYEKQLGIDFYELKEEEQMQVIEGVKGFYR